MVIWLCPCHRGGLKTAWLLSPTSYITEDIFARVNIAQCYDAKLRGQRGFNTKRSLLLKRSAQKCNRIIIIINGVGGMWGCDKDDNNRGSSEMALAAV